VNAGVHTDPRVEQAVIAAILLDTPALTRAIVVDEKVRPEHFTCPRRAAVMAAAIELHDTDSGTSVVAVYGRLRGEITPERLEQMTVGDWSPDTIRVLCRDLIRLHAWRTRDAACELLRGAVATHDDGLVDRALTALAAADRQDENSAFDPGQVTEHVLAHIDGKVERPTWHWPLQQLDRMTLGGLRRGQVTLISGPTRHGKSVFLDQVLEQVAKDGASVRLYLNEMSSEERGMRCAARGAVVPHERIINGDLSAQQAKDVLSWANNGGVRFGMQECDGWSAADVARDARHRRLDVVAFDLLDEVPLLHGMSRRETAEESMRIFKQLALGAGCHVLVVSHLNRNRSSQQAWVPIPSLGDIRESGMLANRAHNVIFVWREQDRDTGDPENEGSIRLAKARQGRLGQVPVLFDGDRQRFLPDHSPELRSVA
jgi:replicative DNA helicase